MASEIIYIIAHGVCTENLVRVDHVTEQPVKVSMHGFNFQTAICKREFATSRRG
jgi:hypothetical protein